VLQQKVLAWLESSGFPLEMAAANAFRREKFEVRQSTPYLDPETEKGREIDVLAIDPDYFGAIEINFVMECKSSSKPWIVLTSDDAFGSYNRFFAFAVMSQSASSALVEKAPDLGCWPFVERRDEGGYGFRQALSDGGDAAYTAAMGVMKACADMVRSGESKSYKPLVFAFPAIVVDAPLFECRLLADGNLHLKEVAESEFLFTAHIPKPLGCSIRVLTKSQLPQFAARSRELARVLRGDLKAEEMKVLSFLG
jgi:hypothetical protein